MRARLQPNGGADATGARRMMPRKNDISLRTTLGGGAYKSELMKSISMGCTRGKTDNKLDLCSADTYTTSIYKHILQDA